MKLLTLTFPLLIGGLAVCGCSDSGGGGSSRASAGTGQLNVQVTDAPLRDLSKVSKAEITVERVLIHAAQISSSTTAASTSTAPMTSSGMAQGQGQGQMQGQQGQGAQNQGPQGANAMGQNPMALANSQAGSNPNSGGAASQGQGANAGGSNPNAKGQSANGVNAGTGGQEITIFDAVTAGAPKVFNLLDLRGGIMAELANANLPAGRYTHMRLELSGAELVVDGVSYSLANGLLTIPSGATSGLKIPFGGAHSIDIQAGQATQTLLDFDLSRSFNVIGPPTRPTSVTLSPVIRGANLGTSGNIAGVLLSDAGTPADPSDDVPLENVVVTATEANVPAGQQANTITTFTDAAGVYYVPGLADGDWDLLFQEPAHDDSTQTAVTVSARKQTTVDATLTRK